MSRIERFPAQHPRAASVCSDRQPDDSQRDVREHEREVLQAIRDTTFGTIEVTVHQSRIVQITRSEKLRF